MAALLSLLSAAVFGVGDFCGGMATKRATGAAVLLWSHVIGLLLVILAVPLVGGELTGHDVLLGALGGLGGAAASGSSTRHSRSVR